MALGSGASRIGSRTSSPHMECLEARALLSSATVSVLATDALAAETPAGAAANRGVFTITRKGGNIRQPLTVQISLSQGSAKPGLDFTDPGVTLVIPAGKTSKTLALAPIYDHLREATESAKLVVLRGTGYVVATAASSARVSITNYHAAPTLALQSGVERIAFSGMQETAYNSAVGDIWSQITCQDDETNIAPALRVERVLAGSLSVTGVGTAVAGKTLIRAGTTWRWTPPEGAVGRVAAFTLRATDGQKTSSATITVYFDLAADPTPTLPAYGDPAQSAQWNPVGKYFGRVYTQDASVMYARPGISPQVVCDSRPVILGVQTDVSLSQLQYDSSGVAHVFQEVYNYTGVLALEHYVLSGSGWTLAETIIPPISAQGRSIVKIGPHNVIHILKESGSYGTNASGQWVWTETGCTGTIADSTYGLNDWAWHHASNSLDLAIDKDGFAHIVGGAVYATNRSGTWKKTVLDRSVASQYASGTLRVLWGSSLAINPLTNRPVVVLWTAQHAATGSIGSTALTCYTLASDRKTWKSQRIPAAGTTFVGSDGRRDGGAGVRLGFDKKGRAHVVFMDLATGHNPHQYSITGQIRHAVCSTAGVWTVETIYRQTKPYSEAMLGVGMAIGDTSILFVGNRLRNFTSVPTGPGSFNPPELRTHWYMLQITKSL